MVCGRPLHVSPATAHQTRAEYIRLLRQHVAKGRRENALSAVHRHLDTSAFWRAEYERLKGALDSADDERLRLKLEIDRLRASGDAEQPTAAPKKRKKQADAGVVPVPRSPKRTKQHLAPEPAELTPLSVDAGFSFYHLGETGKPIALSQRSPTDLASVGDALMRSFYQAHALLKSRERTDPYLLALHLNRGAKAVSDILQELSKQGPAASPCDLDTLQPVLTAASRAMQSLLVGYARISHVAHGNEVQGQVTYAYVRVFDTSLTVMTEAATFDLLELPQDALYPTLRPSTSNGRSKQETQTAVRQTKHPVAARLTSFITGNIELLETRTELHKPLFEGLAYLVIEKLAGCLYTLVFGRARAATIEEEIAASVQPDDIEDATGPPRTSPDDIKVKLAKLEAPYYIQMMTRLMQAAPLFFGASGTAKNGKSKGTSKQGPLKANLAITAKERLQNTLVDCMFGAEGRDGEDLFLDCLQKPPCTGSQPAPPAAKEADVQEWYKEEVWRLLGWEIMSREQAW